MKQRPTAFGRFPIKRIILRVGIFLLVIGLLSTCNGGFNLVMYNHLKNPENYITATATVTKIGRGEAPYLKCVFDEGEIVRQFRGSSLSKDDDPTSYSFTLEIPDQSYRLLTERGFFDHLAVGDTVTVTASPFIYMDGEFFYIAALTHDGTEYLSVGEGMENIHRMMRRDPSLL